MPQAKKKLKKLPKPIKNGKFVLKDSGNRRKYKTGAQKDKQVGKGRYDLISPISIRRLASIMEVGALKYSSRNWEQGLPLCDHIDSAKRHLDQLIEGQTDEDHAGQAFWHIHCLIHTKEMIDRGLLPKELNDLPNYLSKGK